MGFYSTLAAVMIFADLGFSATLNREMARLSADDLSSRGIGDLLRTYEIIYGLISITLAVLVFVAAPVIANRWLHATHIPPADVVGAIRLMGFAIACELPAGLYSGGLMGLQRQVLSNTLQVAWGVLRGVGAIVVLWLISPTIIAFFAWQLFSNALYLLVTRASIWRVVSTSFGGAAPRYRSHVISNTRRYAAGMAAMAIVFTLLTQADKLTISRMLPLEMLGYYTLAAALASVPTMLAGPISVAVFPRLTALAAVGDRVALTALFNRTCSLISLATIPAGITLAFLGSEFIFAWTGSHTIARQAGPVASLLLVGQVLQSLQIVPYHFSLAHGNVRINLINGVVSILFITPILIFLIGRFGILGAGASWLTLNVCALPIYMHFFNRHFGMDNLAPWLTRYLLMPLFATLPIAALGYWIAPETASRLAVVGYIGLVWASSFALTIVLFPDLRLLVGHQLKLTSSGP